jgi:hypothetical protein
MRSAMSAFGGKADTSKRLRGSQPVNSFGDKIVYPKRGLA